MSIIKKLCVSVILGLCFSCTSYDKETEIVEEDKEVPSSPISDEKMPNTSREIGLVSSFVKNESDILNVGVAEDNIPIFVVKEEREGYVSTITEYFIIYGKEKVGPFDEVLYFDSSPDGKTLAYDAIVDGENYIFIGKEKVNWFYRNGITLFKFSADGKVVEISSPPGPSKRVFFDSQTYTGSICAGKVVYIKDGKIMLRE